MLKGEARIKKKQKRKIFNHSAPLLCHFSMIRGVKKGLLIIAIEFK